MPHFLIEGKHANAGPSRLVKAASKAQAVAHVVSADYTVTTAGVDEVVAAMQCTLTRAASAGPRIPVLSLMNRSLAIVGAGMVPESGLA